MSGLMQEAFPGLSEEQVKKAEERIDSTAIAITKSLQDDNPDNIFKTGTLFFILSVIYMVAAQINHIDDTDETYGYWEPLHYLMYGTGMQTWEYSPDFAIRSYAFIAPFYGTGSMFKLMGIKKLQIFKTIKVLLGIISAYSAKKMSYSISKKYGQFMTVVFCCLVIASPGIFYASTSLLPSALCMSLVMLSASNLLEDNYLSCIFWGSVAVLWTGWPFVGVIFGPFGLFILKKEMSQKSISSFIVFLIKAIAIVVLTGGSAASIDFYYYKKLTFPTLNIAIYNAGGNGDNLYGIEDIQYYVRNLLLTTIAALPLSLLTPVGLILNIVIKGVKNIDSKLMVLFSSAIIWAALLFSRPHKEERFMYPILPLICLMGAYTVNSFSMTIVTVLSLIWPGKESQVSSSLAEKSVADNTPFSPNYSSSEPSTAAADADLDGAILEPDASDVKGDGLDGCSTCGPADRDRSLSQSSAQDGLELPVGQSDQGNNGDSRKPERRNSFIYHFVLIVTITLLVIFSLIPGISRICSNYYNYGGYMSLWDRSSQHLTSSKPTSGKKPAPTTSVCMGGNWYTFCSHFFLPPNHRLEYFKDGFGGILPQHFAPGNGTFAAPLKAFNGLNKEELDRYVDLSTCDYLVIDSDSASNLFSRVQQEGKALTFEELDSTSILSYANSTNSIARSFYIPSYSTYKNVFKSYSLYKVTSPVKAKLESSDKSGKVKSD